MILLKDVIPAEVAAVPPLATGKAVPERVTANVPAEVIGDPLIERKEGTVMATEVTVPVPAEDQVPSPRQKVEEEAPVPELRLFTDRFPVIVEDPKATVNPDPVDPDVKVPVVTIEDDPAMGEKVVVAKPLSIKDREV